VKFYRCVTTMSAIAICVRVSPFTKVRMYACGKALRPQRSAVVCRLPRMNTFATTSAIREEIRLNSATPNVQHDKRGPILRQLKVGPAHHLSEHGLGPNDGTWDATTASSHNAGDGENNAGACRRLTRKTCD